MSSVCVSSVCVDVVLCAPNLNQWEDGREVSPGERKDEAKGRERCVCVIVCMFE